MRTASCSSGLSRTWVFEREDETFAVLSHLVGHGKELFLTTNSPFSFMNKGTWHRVGANWSQLFSVITIQAGKLLH